MSKWQPMDSREWGEGSPPVIIAVNRAAKLGENIYVVGEAKHHGEDGWWWAGNDPTDHWGSREYPDFWMDLPAPPPSNTLETSVEPVAGAGQLCQLCGHVHDLTSACPPNRKGKQ